MRTDITIDRKQVKLPNASTIGFGKWKAQFGDIVITQGPEGKLIGRVVGRIAFAPYERDLRNHLVCVCFGFNQTHAMERWINPADVVECYNPQDYGNRDVAAFFAFMIGPEFRKHSTIDLRAWANWGSSSIDSYLKAKSDREKEIGQTVSHLNG